MVTQGDHSDGHGQLGEFRDVGLLLLLQLKDIFIWCVSKIHLITQFLFLFVVTALVVVNNGFITPITKTLDLNMFISHL